MHHRVIPVISHGGVRHVLRERRMIPEAIFTKLLEPGDVQESVEGRPEVPLVTVIIFHDRVEHMMRHLSNVQSS